MGNAGIMEASFTESIANPHGQNEKKRTSRKRKKSDMQIRGAVKEKEV